MKLTIIETTAEAHGEYTQRINSFDRRDIELFNLDVSLATDGNYTEDIESQDVVILGAGLQQQAPHIARRCLALNSKLRIIMFVDDAQYSAGAFRAAYAAGVQKVLSSSASKLDLLQELVAIFDSLRREGVLEEATVVCVLQVKGGVGTTTISAALGDLCNSFKKKTLLWDFDTDSVDLCRSLSMSAVQAMPPSLWFEQPDITREVVQQSIVSLTEYVSLLPPPRATVAEAYDFIGHTDSVAVCGRTLDLARSMYDVVIVDSAGKHGPALGAIISAADYVVVVIDDSIIGLTGINMYLYLLHPLVADPSRLLFLVNGGSKNSLAIREVQQNIQPMFEITQSSWRLPALHYDPACANWPGSGKTMYSMGSRETKQTIKDIASLLELY